MTRHKLNGVWGTIQLPFNQDERVDRGLLDEQIQYLVATNLYGLYSNGTAAEFYNQTEAEFDDIQVMLAERCVAVGKPFQIGVSHMSPIVSLERLRRIKQLAPAAFQVIFPDWLPLSRQEQRSFLARMSAEAAPIPLVLYLPGHAKNKPTLDVLRELAVEFPALVGIKTGFVAPDAYEAARALHQQLAVFVPGHHLATGLIEGFAAGSYSNMACINPAAACRWYNTILDNPEEGLRMQWAIHRFFDKVIIPLVEEGYSDPALDKLLAAAGGNVPGNPTLRWPHRGFDATQIAYVRQEGAALLPEFFN